MGRVSADSDSDVLALLGKKQQLKRRFGFWSIFGFAVCELITWETGPFPNCVLLAEHVANI